MCWHCEVLSGLKRAHLLDYVENGATGSITAGNELSPGPFSRLDDHPVKIGPVNAHPACPRQVLADQKARLAQGVPSPTIFFQSGQTGVNGIHLPLHNGLRIDHAVFAQSFMATDPDT